MAFTGSTYHIITYGCQMNKNDTEKIAAILDSLGLREEPSEHNADLVILNTCSVRDKAERRALGKLGQLKHLKKTRPGLIIGICGCMPQYQKESLRQKVPFLNLILGTNTIHRLPELLSEVSTTGCVMDIADTIQITEMPVPPKRSSLHQAWIPIMFGCDNFCSYCIVPYTRGREKSRKREDIIREIEALDKNVYHQIMLLGQNVNSYGKGLYDDYGFPDLLKDVSRIPDISSIDFLTSHPKDMSDRLIEVISAVPLISRSIHLPLQSGDDTVLKRMNRHYTVEEYRKLVKRVRSSIPGVEISTDLIVGFPGETEEQFRNTLKAVRELRFSRVNTAAYSPRVGTPAASMPDQLPPKERNHRLQQLMDVIDETLLTGL